MRRLTEYAAHERNSMWGWSKIRNPLRVALNYLVIRISGVLPSLKIKNALYRSIGVKVGKNVSIGVEVTFDIFFPELVEIGDNSVIGYHSTLLCHEFLVGKWKKGPVRIGRNVLIGANTTVLAGVVIESGATVSACSLVNEDIARDAFVGGVPAREIRSESAT
ncbi:MAG: acyltransferase [Halobacteriota archaeon]